MKFLWKWGILIVQNHLLTEKIQFSVNGPLPEGENTQYNDVCDWNEHQQAHSAAVPCLGENPPVDNSRKYNSYHTENEGTNNDGCRCSTIQGNRTEHGFLLV